MAYIGYKWSWKAASIYVQQWANLGWLGFNTKINSFKNLYVYINLAEKKFETLLKQQAILYYENMVVKMLGRTLVLLVVLLIIISAWLFWSLTASSFLFCSICIYKLQTWKYTLNTFLYMIWVFSRRRVSISLISWVVLVAMYLQLHN